MDNIQTLITDNLHIWSTALDEKKSGRGRGAANKGSIYGIKKLRELILDLAVRGKLVPQDPNDEPASELLKRIEAEKQELIKEGKIKKEKPLAPISDDEKPFDLPNGWENILLGNICIIERGGSPRPIQDFLTSSEDGINWIKIGDTEIGGKYIKQTSEKIKPDGLKKSRMVYSGDFLLTNSMSFGRPYITLIDGCIHDGWLRVSPPMELDKNYLYHLLSSGFIHNLFRKAAAGAVVLNLNADKVREINIPLPPLAEQHRIVAKVDELMKLCDDLEAGIIKSYDVHSQLVETLLNNLCSSQNNDDFNSTWQIIYNNFETLFTTEESIEKLKQSILQLAIMGKLVVQDPNDEPASELLKRIATEKQKLITEGKLKKEKPLPPITEAEKPFDLPKGWCFTKLAELGEFGRGKSKHRPRNEPKLFQNGIYPLVQTGEVSRADWVINEYHSKYSDFGLAQSKMWPKNTLCITIAANIADAAILGFDACFPDSVVGLVCSEANVKIDYIMYFMKTARNDLIKFAPATAQKNINLEILSQINVPIPPLNEQVQIVAKVEELMALCDELKSKITLANQTKITLANALSQNLGV